MIRSKANNTHRYPIEFNFNLYRASIRSQTELQAWTSEEITLKLRPITSSNLCTNIYDKKLKRNRQSRMIVPSSQKRNMKSLTGYPTFNSLIPCPWKIVSLPRYFHQSFKSLFAKLFPRSISLQRKKKKREKKREKSKGTSSTLHTPDANKSFFSKWTKLRSDPSEADSFFIENFAIDFPSSRTTSEFSIRRQRDRIHNKKPDGNLPLSASSVSSPLHLSYRHAPYKI